MRYRGIPPYPSRNSATTATSSQTYILFEPALMLVLVFMVFLYGLWLMVLSGPLPGALRPSRSASYTNHKRRLLPDYIMEEVIFLEDPRRCPLRRVSSGRYEGCKKGLKGLIP